MLRIKVHLSGPVYHALAFFGRVKSGGIICGPREGKPLFTIIVSLGGQNDAWTTSCGLSEDLKLFPGWHGLNKVLTTLMALEVGAIPDKLTSWTFETSIVNPAKQGTGCTTLVILFEFSRECNSQSAQSINHFTIFSLSSFIFSLSRHGDFFQLFVG